MATFWSIIRRTRRASTEGCRSDHRKIILIIFSSCLRPQTGKWCSEIGRAEEIANAGEDAPNQAPVIASSMYSPYTVQTKRYNTPAQTTTDDLLSPAWRIQLIYAKRGLVSRRTPKYTSGRDRRFRIPSSLRVKGLDGREETLRSSSMNLIATVLTLVNCLDCVSISVNSRNTEWELCTILVNREHHWLNW